MVRSFITLVIGLGLIGCSTAAAKDKPASLTADIRISDPEKDLGRDREVFEKNLKVAFADFASTLEVQSPTQVRILVSIEPRQARDIVSSTPLVEVARDAQFAIVESSCAHKIKTGESNPANPQDPDLVIHVDPYFAGEKIWYDRHPHPDPRKRKKEIPDYGRWDAIASFTHELLHGCGGIQTLRDRRSGNVESGRMTVYDQMVSKHGSVFRYQGTHTGGFDLTSDGESQNITHFGVRLTEANSDEIMQGGIEMGRRYTISDIDLAVMKDLGLPVKTLRAKK